MSWVMGERQSLQHPMTHGTDPMTQHYSPTKMKILIQNGHVVDPANRREGRFDILIGRGKIVDVQPSALGPRPSALGFAERRASPRNESSIAVSGAKRIDAKDMIVVPGLVDLHSHLREPGREDKETIESGCRAAIRGGFTAICAMPNTTPIMDHPGVVQQLRHEAQRVALASVLPIGAITKGQQGEVLTDFGELFNAGCVALSDDGHSVMDSLLMRRALEYAKPFDRPLIQHAEDTRLSSGGVMHEGLLSTTLGLQGIPAEAESVIVARDLALAELTGGWLHVAHLSCAQSVELIRQAKRRGVRVTCEVTPHHLTLTHEAVGEFDTSAKVNPPLRTEQDRLSLIEGLCDGTIDCIATDHAPHTDWEKAADFESAPFGISGLETALSVCVETLVLTGKLSWPQLVEKMSFNPARIAGLDAGTLSVGREANIALINPKAQWKVDPQQFLSKGRHSPFAGRTLTARVIAVLCQGQEVSS